MKKTILKITTLFALFAVSTHFGQGTGNLNAADDGPKGIQNKYGIEDTRNVGGGVTSVLVLGAPGTASWIDDVEAKLDGTGLVAADTFLINSDTPTFADLIGYDAVFMFTDASPLDPVALGDVVGEYIEAGGAVVDATFTPNISVTGGFTPYELYIGGGQASGANLMLSAILVPGDPIVENVTGFDGGTSSFHNTGGIVAAGATVVAEWEDGEPLIIRSENAGTFNARRVFLNFYPPSTGARDDFWDADTDGDIIMANSLVWAADKIVNDEPSVLIAGSPGTETWINDVEMKLEATGALNADTFLTNMETPTLAQLQNYDAVFLFTDGGPLDPVALGDVVGEYIDGGGAVVDATFTPNVAITGGFTPYELYTGAGQTSGANLMLGSILVPDDPILTDVTSFDGGTSSFHNGGGAVAVGATVVAEWEDGAPLIIRNENVGPADVRRVFLNFYPPSIDARDDFWDTSTDGGTIMINSLLWAINGDLLSIDNNELANGITLYPNPTKGEFTLSNTSGLFIDKVQIIDITGRIVKTLKIGEETSMRLDVSSLSAGVYLVRLESDGLDYNTRLIKK